MSRRKTIALDSPRGSRRFSGEALRQARESVGLRREDLAYLAGCGFASLYRYEQQGATPNANKLAQLADVLNVALDDLFTQETE